MYWKGRVVLGIETAVFSTLVGDSDGRPIGPTPEGNETFETEFERNVESVSAVNSKRYAENGINHDLEEIPLDNKRVHDRGAPIEPVSMAWIERARKAATHGVNVDIHKVRLSPP